MEYEQINAQTLPAEQVEELQRAFLMKVFGWMSAGLMITAIVSLFTVSTPALLEAIFSSRIVYFGLIFGQLGLVIYLSARVEKMSAVTATTVFLLYSALTGLTLSVIYLAYTAESLATTFFVSAGTFGLLSAYGYLTRRDLSGLGGFLTMGLIGLVLASLVNLFLGNSTIYWITTYLGVLIFAGLTAYDTQKIKRMAAQGMMQGDAEQKGAIMGALALYLDFINLFLLLLRLTGSRK